MKNKIIIPVIVSIILLVCFNSVSASLYAGSARFDDTGESGYIEATNANYASLVNAITGICSWHIIRTFVNIGYTIQRGYFFFDTSTLPDDCMISSISLSFYVAYKEGTSPFVYLQKADLGNTLNPGDFDKTKYSFVCFKETIATGYHNYNFSFYSNVCDDAIDKTGLSCFSIRNSDDYLEAYNAEYFWEITNMSSVSLYVTYETGTDSNITMTFEINQFSIVILLILMIFFTLIGYLVNNAKTGAAFLMFAGIFSILTLISVDVYFGGIWYLSTPGFIVVALIFFKDMLLMIIYGENWRKGNKK